MLVATHRFQFEASIRFKKIHSLPNCSARRSSGGETIDLSYSGINHECGNIFSDAPKQKTLILVDVVYPGYMSYKNLGIAEDVPGYMEAPKKRRSVSTLRLSPAAM